ncbi:M28 family metallopeptidase [Belliella kenyensis]|uniref:M28 family metallopeptidase n=1 Tax=Belliella kenyensis TaxID=1472724 RepID=A0ABV8EKA5_9BACT|nr:M28 family metallopeptidase [Belliella kenyensis]MCH7403031.1 M28 family metallopeptidase [Belliella kenyensis]MDN3605067.1 M28 family metallopeptidase [Belliella kenyensis]
MKILHFVSLLIGIGMTNAAFAQKIEGFSQRSTEDQLSIEKEFLELVDFKRFKTHLTAITSDPHPAGSAANEKVKDYLVESMKGSGWDVKIHPYDVYLSQNPGESIVEIVLPKRIPLNQQEDVLTEDPFSSHPNLGKGWNAFSGSGDVTAEVVYANYGTKADFEKLKALGIDVKGKIVLARYGGNFRGFKAKFAEEAGAAGLLIYTDPGDSGYMRGLTYPSGIYYNETSIQRGSLLTVDWTGDALTPFEPALPLDAKQKIKRLDPKDVGLHTIPVTAIPYGSARLILEKMKGSPVPAGWQGGLPFTYRLEGDQNLQVRLKVEQKREFVRANNVIGTLKGSELPDEWIILGCHYDAWSFGSTDPNSGTAMLLALSESLGKMAKEGNIPKRSILIAHWDAEEHGVIGSTEWVEQFRDELQTKAVAYINLDAAVSGRNFGMSSSPTLKNLIVEASKAVNFPDSSKTVYEVWTKDKEEPSIGNLGGGSDHIAFYMHAGIPSLSGGASGPTLYHTNYDNLYFYEKFADPSFKMGGMMEQVVGIMTLRLANAPIIPYQISRYSRDLKIHFTNANEQIRKFDSNFSGFQRVQQSLEALEETQLELEKIMSDFLTENNVDNKKALKDVNKILLSLEKSFLDPKGMYFGSWYRSIYASNDPFSGYASWILPGLQYEIELKSSERLDEWDIRYATAIEDLRNKLKNLIKLIHVVG